MKMWAILAIVLAALGVFSWVGYEIKSGSSAKRDVATLSDTVKQKDQQAQNAAIINEEQRKQVEEANVRISQLHSQLKDIQDEFRKTEIGQSNRVCIPRDFARKLRELK